MINDCIYQLLGKFSYSYTNICNFEHISTKLLKGSIQLVLYEVCDCRTPKEGEGAKFKELEFLRKK